LAASAKDGISGCFFDPLSPAGEGQAENAPALFLQGFLP
jgi:hypothetical protein